ncbi:MAG: ribonuclease III [candidate division NC10 bacterium]|nr:ribonuclease III [candidate division NC10 bacterium]MDE2322097.1 ribonuclease III [candidate division NC10 bacterium]
MIRIPSPPLALFGHRFRDPTLLEAALTHPSSTDPAQTDLRLRYQRLEFLGDAVWNLYVSDALVSLLPTASEGELTLRRANLVSAAALADMAQLHGLAPLVVLSKGEELTGGRQKARVLSTTFEAVIGAIYLDGGAKTIRDLARKACVGTLEGERLTLDPKTALQQLAQSRLHSTPRYRLIRRSGAAHAPTFEVEVMVGRLPIAKGKGRNRQEAEREAAHTALGSLTDQLSTTSGSHNIIDY